MHAAPVFVERRPRQATDRPARRSKSKKRTRASTGETRANTKQAQLIALLKRPDGATVDEIVNAFGWQPHTVRGAIAGALKKKLGLNVQSEKDEQRARLSNRLKPKPTLKPPELKPRWLSRVHTRPGQRRTLNKNNTSDR